MTDVTVIEFDSTDPVPVYLSADGIPAGTSVGAFVSDLLVNYSTDTATGNASLEFYITIPGVGPVIGSQENYTTFSMSVVGDMVTITGSSLDITAAPLTLTYSIADPTNLTISGQSATLGDVTGTVEINGVGGSIPCFADRTQIRTIEGDIAVEELCVGDVVLTASGEARPIQWLGHRRIERPAREQWPVRVLAGAFGDNLPSRDLMLSPGHAVCVSVLDEVFVPVGELVNGTTVTQVEVDAVTYWHVELESHDVLLAEGLPCESYMDAGNRAFFGREYGRLQAIDPVRVAESLTRYARPFVDAGPIVEAIRQRLDVRAETLVWTAERRRAA